MVASNHGIFSEFFSVLYFSKHLLFVLLFLSLVITSKLKYNKIHYFSTSTLLIFCVYIILNSILFGDFQVGILRSLNVVIFVFVLIFLNQKKLKIILTTYSVSLLVFLILFSFQSYLLGYEIFSKTAIINSENLQTRLLLGFNHPGVLALQVLSVSLIGLIFWKHRMLNLVLSFIFLLSTGAQNSLFGLLIFIVSYYRSSKKIFTYLFALSLGLILIIGPEFDSLNSLSSGDRKSVV